MSAVSEHERQGAILLPAAFTPYNTDPRLFGRIRSDGFPEPALCPSPQAAEGLQQQGPGSLRRGHTQPLAGGVDVEEIRGEGDAVQPGHLAGEDAAFQPRVEPRDPGLFPVQLSEDLNHRLPQGGIRPVLPGGVGGGDLRPAAQGLGQQGYPPDGLVPQRVDPGAMG